MNRFIEKWPAMRMLRMAVAIAAIIQAFVFEDVLTGVFGLALGLTAWFNVGCCGSGGCSTGSCRVPQKREAATVPLRTTHDKE